MSIQEPEQTSKENAANASENQTTGQTSKSNEELKKERKEIAMVGMRGKKPKNLQQGLVKGVSAILGGAVGGLGLAVLAPTVGCAAGARRGGIVGGSVGLVGGAAAGIIGAAGLVLGGAVSGAVNIGMGVAAVPASISAPRRGKWWNEATSTWVYTDLTKLQVPENDDDLLGSIEQNLDDGNGTDHTPSGEVKETYYYEALEVETNASAYKIKRQYYLMARKYHPDKNPGDPASVEKFKLAAEAYQVLSDPQLRSKYDKHGIYALSGDMTSSSVGGQQLDPSLLLAFLFGSDRFNSYIGRLAVSTSAMLGDATKLSAIDARILQERRCARLATTLADRIDPWVADEETEQTWRTEAELLKTTSYGWELLRVIGMAYELAALQFLGSSNSGIGMPSVAKWAMGKKAAVKSGGKRKNNDLWETVAAGMDNAKVRSEYETKLLNAASRDEEQQIEQELENASMEIMLRLVWITTSVDIASTIHETCQMVFFDQSVGKDVREMRAQAVKKLGKIFQDCAPPNPEHHPGSADGRMRILFEDATLAATLETIRRKDKTRFETAEESSSA